MVRMEQSGLVFRFQYEKHDVLVNTKGLDELILGFDQVVVPFENGLRTEVDGQSGGQRDRDGRDETYACNQGPTVSLGGM